jgi:hypothetical protein
MTNQKSIDTNPTGFEVIDVLKKTKVAGSSPYAYAFGFVWAGLTDDEKKRVLEAFNTLEQKDKE